MISFPKVLLKFLIIFVLNQEIIYFIITFNLNNNNKNKKEIIQRNQNDWYSGRWYH
jgi:hypothetical protein